MSRPTPSVRAGNPVTRWFGDRSVGAKILVAVLTAAVVAVTVGIVAVANLRSVQAKAEAMYEQGLVPVDLIGDAKVAQDDARRELLNVLISQSRRGHRRQRG